MESKVLKIMGCPVKAALNGNILKKVGKSMLSKHCSI